MNPRDCLPPYFDVTKVEEYPQYGHDNPDQGHIPASQGDPTTASSPSNNSAHQGQDLTPPSQDDPATSSRPTPTPHNALGKSQDHSPTRVDGDSIMPPKAWVYFETPSLGPWYPVPLPTKYFLYTKKNHVGLNWIVHVGDCLETPSDWVALAMAILSKEQWSVVRVATGDLGWWLVPRPMGSKMSPILIRVMAIPYSEQDSTEATCLAEPLPNPYLHLYSFDVHTAGY
ncbi:hypothetical protein BCR34DRAFT_608501 [Clohesyomyces aquaticus]|uniref:Uncharacterized protein n=1 Tax=Clohesyomyces aquaticus TaxID=1231657 RepID=A0A1Y1Y6M6_9PLEO|nr:hypothetical protein BCR34DRAFT_608501 [Clohesyomyces aquaticus]